MTERARARSRSRSWEEDTYQDLAGKEKLTKARMGFQLSGDLG